MARKGRMPVDRVAVRERQYIDKLMSIVISQVDIEGLDDCVNVKRVVEWLIRRNALLYYINPVTQDETISPYVGIGVDIYEDPIEFQPVLPNGQYICRVLQKDECEIIWAVQMQRKDFTTLFDLIKYTAHQLSLIDEIIMLNVEVQRTPYIVNTDSKTATQIKNYMREIQQLDRVLVADKASAAIDSIKVLDLNTPYLGDKLNDLKNAILNDWLTFVGIDNSNTDKSQYVGISEIQSNNEFIDCCQFTFIGSINESFEKVNKKFGKSITCKCRYDVDCLNPQFGYPGGDQFDSSRGDLPDDKRDDPKNKSDSE